MFRRVSPFHHGRNGILNGEGHAQNVIPALVFEGERDLFSYLFIYFSNFNYIIVN